MAKTITCKHCQGTVAKNADKCPHCGGWTLNGQIGAVMGAGADLMEKGALLVLLLALLGGVLLFA
jgi:predicted ATP-dependent serine protease